MKYALAVLALFASAVAQDVGVMLANVGGSSAKRIEIARDLGAKWYRPMAVLMAQPSPACEDCDAARAAGLKLVLVIRNTDAIRKPSTPPESLAAFRARLSTVLDRYKPEILVVENEQDNQKLFYKGTPEEYGAELKVACELAHERKLKCADGGLTSLSTAALVMDEQFKVDPIDAAKFGLAIEATRAHSREPFNIAGIKLKKDAKEYLPVVEVTQKFLDKHRAEIDRARALVKAADEAGADYANFHWYEMQPDVIPRVTDVLHQLTKRPLMCDEAGQRTERAFEVGEKIRVLLDNGVSPVIWFAVDGAGGAVGLVDKDGTLRPNAAAFKKAAAEVK